MSPTLTIAKRELRANFDSAALYVVVCICLPVLALFFFYYEGGFWQANRASFERLFLFAARGISAVVVPVVTMRLVAEERRSGTLEMLITLPVKDHQVIVGKFLSAWAVTLILIASTMLFPILMFKAPWSLGSLDWGPVITGYLGLVLLSAAGVSVGLLISSITESQIVAVLVTGVLLVLLHVCGMFLDKIDNHTMQQVFAFISFDSRMAPFARGLLTTRDVLYFLSITALCLMTAFSALERRKWA
ncbi:MAG: ABC transporter permease subunit [Myxococcales bacterium]|nr:ABC transporter permease subunit [Myxococcales bacterium]